MLSQTNFGQNDNKFYLLQLLCAGDNHFVWSRWGRVGQIGQHSLMSFGRDLSRAKHEFVSKFFDKTRNKWENRRSFKAMPGRYTLIEIDVAASPLAPAALSPAMAAGSSWSAHAAVSTAPLVLRLTVKTLTGKSIPVEVGQGALSQVRRVG